MSWFYGVSKIIATATDVARFFLTLGSILLVSCFLPSLAFAERLKDISSFAGVRSNPLVGYGIVVGLNGTGDGSLEYTIQSMKSIVSRFGVVIPADTKPGVKNSAAVMLTAELPAFAKPGQTIDVTVNAFGMAKSLRGGTLLLSALKGADGQTYAMAQGNLAVGGLGVEGADGSKITINIPSVGRIPGGATVEKMVDTPFNDADYIILNMNTADFTTIGRASRAINQTFGELVASPIDSVSIKVAAPKDVTKRIEMASLIENIEVESAGPPARVVVNSRTGTIVIGSNVIVQPAAVAHGNLTVTISEDETVSQPNALAQGGETARVKDTELNVQNDPARMFLFNPGVELKDIVNSINAVGASPGDLVAILEALKQVGALKAELKII